MVMIMEKIVFTIWQLTLYNGVIVFPVYFVVSVKLYRKF